MPDADARELRDGRGAKGEALCSITVDVLSQSQSQGRRYRSSQPEMRDRRHPRVYWVRVPVHRYCLSISRGAVKNK
jgi:hypothetical protein